MNQGFTPAWNAGAGGPSALLSKEFRNRFIIAPDNFNFLVIWERKWLPVWPLRRKIQYWAELRANEMGHAPTC
jgi:hypothetical protein